MIYKKTKKLSTKEPNKENASIMLWNGYLFNPFNPDPNIIDLTSVAVGTSHKCRFGGQTSEFYSVLEHEINVAFDMLVRTENVTMALVGLHHDDEEGLLTDVPTPIKVLPEFEFWRKMEDNVRDVCYKKFIGSSKKNWKLTAKEEKELHMSDKRMMLCEAGFFMRNPALYHKKYQVAYEDLTSYTLATRDEQGNFFYSRLKNPVFMRNYWKYLHTTWSNPNKITPKQRKKYSELYNYMFESHHDNHILP